jgi:hypothetical protein
VDLLTGGDPTGLHSYYYWYHGTLAMFLHGGSDWQAWNAALIDEVLAMQDRAVSGAGKPRHSYGSWPALGPGWGKWGRTGGRVYATALGVLTLETYYRYAPAYATANSLIRSSTLRVGLRQQSASRRRRVLAVATQVPVEVGEPALVEALDYPDPRLQLGAAIGLAGFSNPLGRPILEAHLPEAVGEEQEAIEHALARLDAATWGPDYGSVIRLDTEHGLVVFQTDGGAVYFGQLLEARRAGKAICQLRVTRRLSQHPLAVARIVGEGVPRIGDTVHLNFN